MEEKSTAKFKSKRKFPECKKPHNVEDCFI